MRFVQATGPRNQPLLALVGEAPGKDEETQGKPFVGMSGRLLDRMLSNVGISRSECFITNVCNVRPPGNDFSHFYQDGDKREIPTGELLEQRKRLWTEIRSVQPKLVVALGKEALKALTHFTDLENYRGTIIEKFDIRVLPTYHPAYILRVYGDKPVVESDLKKAFRQSRCPNCPDTRFNINPSFSEVLEFLSSTPPLVSIDIETLGQHTRCIGFAWSDTEAIIIPFIERGSSYWSEEEEAQILEALSRFCSNPQIKKVLQNAPFDVTRLAKEFGIHIDGIILDTMYAHHTLYSELRKGLDFLVSIYTDFPMYWDYDRSNDESTKTYCGYDCVATYQIAQKLRSELDEAGLSEFYDREIHPALFALTRMQNRGIKVNTTERTKIREETVAEMEAISSRINQFIGYEINPKSTKQTAELLYDKWKMPTQRKGKSVTTDKPALKELARKASPERAAIIKDIIKYRENGILISTFIDVELSEGDRMKTSYNLAGTVTGRISSSATIDDEGGNLQNIPRGSFRRLFCADPGHKLIKADLSQAEFRLLVWFGRIRRIIEKYLTDPFYDIHTWNAAENIYHVPIEQVTKLQRSNAKNGIYGSSYGMKPLKASRVYDLDLATAKFVLNALHKAIPEIEHVYQKEIKEAIETTRIITNPLGRRRVFFGRVDDDMFRAAYSHLCQSTVGDIILQAIVELDLLGYCLLLQVHDELVLQCPNDKVDETCFAVKKTMEIPITIKGVPEPLIIPTEISVGDDWFNCKPWTPPAEALNFKPSTPVL